MSIVKKISLDVSLYMRLIHQENKFPIHVIRMRYPPPPKKKKKKFVQVEGFPIVFVTGI